MDKSANTKLRFWLAAVLRLCRLGVLAILVGGFSGLSAAEDSTAPPKPAAVSDSSGPSEKTTIESKTPLSPPATKAIEYVGPDTYILLDADGHPQPMPGMTYEDFIGAWRKLSQPPPEDNAPSYSIESLDFDGAAVDQRAELKCKVKVRLLADGRRSVPLGLVGAILQGEPHFSTAADAETDRASGSEATTNNKQPECLTYDSENGGYVAHFNGQSGDVRQLSIRLIVPLQHDGAETTLALNCPRSVSSQLLLNLDARSSEYRVSTGTIVANEHGPDEGTRLTVAGPAGLFRLTWQSANNEAQLFSSVLNVLGAIHVTLDGRGVRTDARLTVRSYGGTFDQFRIRLPAGAQLVQANPEIERRKDAPYRLRIEPETSPPGPGQQPRGQTVLVELSEKQQGPVVVDLATQQSGGAGNENQDLKIDGFEVIGAVRQFGDVALTVTDDWQARWELGSFVRQVDPDELDATLQATNPTAAFQYDRQPWSISARVARRQLRVHVTPKYELECLPEESRLNVRLSYQVFGARAFEFRVELNGWEMTGDPIESGSLVDQDRIVVTPEGSLLLPLSQTSTRRAEISFSVRRPLKREAARLQMPLPVPAADSIGTGELIVRAAPDVELSPDLSASTGLTASSTPEVTEGPSVDGTTQLRYRTLLPAAVFVADRKNRTREITADTSTRIQIVSGTAQVESRVDYIVRFEPIAELSFEVPSQLMADENGLEVRLVSPATGTADAEQSVLLHPAPNQDDSGSVLPTASRIFRAMLPRPAIGKFAAIIQHRNSLPPINGTQAKWAVPLVQPVDGRSASNRVAVVLPSDLAMDSAAAHTETTWKPAEDSSANGEKSPVQFATEERALEFPLSVRVIKAASPSTTVVERVWLQTWLTQEIEQDRAAFRVRSGGNQLTVELPPEGSTSEVEVILNGQPAEIASRTLGRLVIRLPAAREFARRDLVEYTLELRWRKNYRHDLLSNHRFTPPQIEEGSTALSQVYWQVVVPGDEHILVSPPQLVAAYDWQWLGVFFGRRPLKDQPMLEAWAGASTQAAPTNGQNEYLFTSLSPLASIELTIAPRWLIVFVASLLVVGLSIAWIYMPQSQRRWLLVAFCMAIAFSAVVYPAMTLLVAQAALLGAILSGVAILVARLSTHSRRSPVRAMASPSSQRVLTSRAESLSPPAFIATGSTAPTTSLRLSESQR